MFGSNKASTVKCSVMDRTPQMTSTPASAPVSTSQVNFALEYERARLQVEAEEQMMQTTGLPPRRPQRNVRQPPGYQQSREYQRARDDFLADFENSCLRNYWDGAPPKGANRHENTEWAEMIQSLVYPHHSDVDWYEYCEWVTGGGGDEWFYDEE